MSHWRETEIIATLVRKVKLKAPDAIIGRIFTAVNQDGLVVLIGARPYFIFYFSNPKLELLTLGEVCTP